jgi:hypothetical protein
MEVQSRFHEDRQQPPRILRWDNAQRTFGHIGISNRQVLLSPT